MSQKIWTTINPLTTSGLMLAALLDDFKDAIMTGYAGNSRPSALQAGGMWVDTTNQAAPNYYWAYKFYTGVDDIEIFRISIINGFGGTLMANGTFTIKETADDNVGAVLEMVKQRIANNGQILSGDTVGEIRFTGRTNSATDPTLAYFRWTSTDDETVGASGGTLSFFSTPDATAAIKEHFRFINGIFETVAPHKVNSVRWSSQNVATSANINQLNADTMVVEMTGATVTNINGINSAGLSQTVTIHNRSSANVTLKHQSGSATAADRLKLPKSTDLVIEPESTATLYYCTTDTRWKLKDTIKGKNKTITTVTKNLTRDTWTSPITGKVKVVTHRSNVYPSNNVGVTDDFGNAYCWGFGTDGQNGDGGFVPRSLPVAVLGGHQFRQVKRHISALMAMRKDGTLYGWGGNFAGQLGDGTTLAKSSPVAVLGGLRFAKFLVIQQVTVAGLTPAGKVYTWGTNTNGQLGDGTTTPKSSPVAVLGNLTFVDIFGGHNCFFGLTASGDIYGWGDNSFGQLGVGDVTPRSSPVAVLSGTKKWVKLPEENPYELRAAAMMAIADDGVTYAWGANDSGVLGDGTTTDRSSPVAVLGGLNFNKIYVCGQRVSSGTFSHQHAFGLLQDGTTYGWGRSNNGFAGTHIGVGQFAVTSFSSPVAVLGGLKFDKIFSCQDNNGPTIFAHAITKDGDLYAWGKGDSGQLGDNSLSGRSSPILIMSGTKFYAQQSFFGRCAQLHTTDGRIFATGNNQYGSLAQNNVTSVSSPVQIIGAIGQQFRDTTREYIIDVTSGVTYNIICAPALSKFGDIPLGGDVEYITISYES